jgi:ABC-type transport system involved in multi-copper enzyme maturation permease subunit
VSEGETRGLVVLRKELLTNLRSPRAFLGLLGFLVILIISLWARWPAPGLLEVETRARTARAIFEAIRETALVLVAFLAPAASAGAITLEREQEALELLLVTPLRPRKILYEKLLSAVAFLVLALVATLPVTTATTLLGGVAADEVAATYGVIGAAAVGFAAVGVALSTFSERTFGALFLSYAAVMPVAFLILWQLRRCGDAASTTFLLAAVGCAALGATYLLIAAAAARLAEPPPPPPPPADEEDVDDQAVLSLDRTRFPDVLILPFSLGSYLPDRTNPIYEKEVRFEVFGKGTALVRGMIVVGLIGTLAAILGTVMLSSSIEGGGGPLVTVYMTFFLLMVVPPFAASSISGERERRTLDLIASTTLSPRAFVVGKLLGCLRTPLVIAGMLCIYAPFMLIHGETIPGLLREATVALAALVLATSLALLFSAVLGSTLRALVASYVAVVGLFVAPFLGGPAITRLLGPRAGDAVLSVSTFWAILEASGDMGVRPLAAKLSSAEVANGVWGRGEPALVPLHLVHIAICLAATAIVLGALVRWFDRLVVRR